MRIEIIIVLILAAALLLACCAFQRPTVERRVKCGADELVVEKHREFVELSWRDRYHLALRPAAGGESVFLTGRVGMLPRAKRYRAMITIEDYNMPSAPRMNELFTTHYINPELVTPEQFAAACRVYRGHREEWPELKPVIGMLVYGDPRMFHEVFDCGRGLFLFTDGDGSVYITDNPSYDMLTIPAEGRHFNHVAFFNDEGRLFLRTGRIVSGVENDIFGHPSKKVAYSGIPGVRDYVNHVEVLWVDLLYNERETGINRELILSAKNAKGERLDKVFRAR